MLKSAISWSDNGCDHYYGKTPKNKTMPNIKSARIDKQGDSSADAYDYFSLFMVYFMNSAYYGSQMF